jgi:hypothetical protein
MNSTNKLVCLPRRGNKKGNLLRTEGMHLSPPPPPELFSPIFDPFPPIFSENIALHIVGDSGPIDGHQSEIS